jgi:acyl-CoA dehydrogenase
MSDSVSMIEQSAGRLFAAHVDKTLLEKVEGGAFPDVLWRLATESGFERVLATEAGGGIGESWEAAFPILRAIGYWQVPLPLAETMIGAMLLSMAGIEVPDGPIAIVEQGLGNTLSGGGREPLSGRAARVPWARHARWALVSLNGGGLALVDLADAATASVAHKVNHARLPSDAVTLDGARPVAQAPSPLPALASPVWTLGAVARSAMMVGALDSVLEQSLRYANDRVQFGRPIGRNQAIQQQLALMAGDVAGSRVAARVAAADAPSSVSPDCSRTVFSAAVAKVRCGEAATRGTAIAHQVHGAIGFTYDHMLNFGTRRLWSWREEFGTDAWWAARLGAAAIAGAGAGFWPAITERGFAQHAVDAAA